MAGLPLEVRVVIPKMAEGIREELVKRLTRRLRSEALPDLERESPRRSGKLARGWSVVPAEDVVIIRNRQFYGLFQRGAVLRRWRKAIKAYALNIGREELAALGVPAIRDSLVDALKQAFPGAGSRRGGGVSFSYEPPRGF